MPPAFPPSGAGPRRPLLPSGAPILRSRRGSNPPPPASPLPPAAMQSAATAATAMASRLLWWAREPDEATTPTSRPPPVELDVVEINVGGQIFTTTPQTLKAQEQSLLAQMFAGAPALARPLGSATAVRSAAGDRPGGRSALAPSAPSAP
jgi:hypothetical protein